MKRMCFVFVLLAGTVLGLYARDFDPSWVARMSEYIGEKVDDIPYVFSATDNVYAL